MMIRQLLLLILIAQAGAIAALAQVTYQVTTAPSFVINTGRAEALGAARITSTFNATTVAGTISFSFGVPCDNTTASGISLATDGVAFIDATNVFISSITNTSSGCVITVSVNANIAVTNSSFIQLQGVRGRIDLLGGITNVGQNINVSLSASPASSSLFTVPNQGVVGITAVGLQLVSVTPGTATLCLGTSTNPALSLREGFNGAFVQHVATLGGSTTPANPRPAFGATFNTQVRIVVTGLPTGVTLTWPSSVTSQLNSGSFTAGSAGSRLERVTSAIGTMKTYEYACGDQGICDVNQEVFNFSGVNAPVVSLGSTASLGTATVQMRLFPDLIPGDATSFTSAPAASNAPRPRFNDPLIPSPAATLLTVASCVPAAVIGEGAAVGVDGLASGNSGMGVLGEASANTGVTIGIRGKVDSAAGTAGIFDNAAGGNIIIATVNAVNKFRVDGSGNVFLTTQNTGGADFAESIAVLGERTDYEPGDVLVIERTTVRHASLALEPYSHLIAGIYSTKPGILASPYGLDDARLNGEIPLAVVGIVPCKVSAENGPIEIGDLLVTSSTPGHAMKGTDRGRMLGAIVGKALEPLREGKGVIQVLVTLQ